MTEAFYSIASANADIVSVTASHEKQGDAMVLHPSLASPHKVADKAWREITHVHSRKDYSIHAVLAPQDCKLRTFLSVHLHCPAPVLNATFSI